VKRTLWFVLLVLAAVAWWRFHVPSETQDVVVYVSHDEVFSEPILRDFEKETGIRVRAVYDTEETKSTGLQ
jgi:iron(III) transport system substrate-binding protein